MWKYSNWKSKHFLKTGSDLINTTMLFLELSVLDGGRKQKLWLISSSHRKKKKKRNLGGIATKHNKAFQSVKWV